jgi:hypothetical protein
MLNIISFLGHENHNHNEVLLDIIRMIIIKYEEKLYEEIGTHPYIW